MSLGRHSTLRVAAIQLASGLNRAENLRQAEEFLGAAVQKGAKLCVLPEHFSYLGTDRECAAQVEPFRGALLAWGCQQASRLGCWLVMGSFLTSDQGDCLLGSPGCCPEHTEAVSVASGSVEVVSGSVAAQVSRVASLPYNVCGVINPHGEVLGEYRKMHLFNSKVPGAGGCEADFVRPGRDCTCLALDEFWSLGLAICYDLRFSEEFWRMRQRGVNLFAVPAAFTERTGRDHWELLVRARAVESQAYVIAANQCGQSGVGRYGHSMIVDPWGKVLAQAGEQPGVVCADLNADYLEEVRQLFG